MTSIERVKKMELSLVLVIFMIIVAVIAGILQTWNANFYGARFGTVNDKLAFSVVQMIFAFLLMLLPFIFTYALSQP